MNVGEDPKKSRGWNEALRSFLATPTRRDADRRFDWLHAEFLSDTVTRVLTEELRRGIYTRPEEIYEDQDTFHDLSVLVQGKIFGRLIQLWEDCRKTDPTTPAPGRMIDNLYAYVVAITQNACVDHLRRKYPGRHALDNALRTALEVRRDLALWRIAIDKDTHEWRCGRSEWRDAAHAPTPIAFSEALEGRLKSELAGLSRAEALVCVFEVTQSPLLFTRLLNFLAKYWNVEAAHWNALRERADFRVPKPYLHGIQPEEVVDMMGLLQNIWEQVKLLNPAQAAVMLLKVPEYENGSFLDAMVRLKVTSWQAMAQVTPLSIALFQKLSLSVPLSDHEIAAVLNIALEDVPRIRQDARRRLARLNSLPPENKN